ncbi:HU family DNA-binding protein [Geoalkalibacter halelectricus]|uniref:HU family DNA-binding protein n=1 Tax=Geoalkalibacter halelectricus TaxID=2847045 RepID=UPI003D1EF1D3
MAPKVGRSGIRDGERISRAQLRAAGGLHGLLHAPGNTRRRNRWICQDGLPSEEQEQRVFCRFMAALCDLWESAGERLHWTHVPMGGKRPKGEGGKMAGFGSAPGVPDNFIFNPPPMRPNAKGVAIELKRASCGETSDDQIGWLTDLAALGWITEVCHGANQAIELLERLGYTQIPGVRGKMVAFADNPSPMQQGGHFMTKSELVAAMADKAGLTKVQSDRALSALVETLTQGLKNGEKIVLTNFGSFSVGERAARTVTNPQTGEKMHSPACKVPKFKAGKSLKDALNG